MEKVVVIGAGVGGLATAAVLAKIGVDVIVLDAHVYPGGCAGTFFHQGYRFEVGATLAGGFYPGGPMDLLAEAGGVKDWAVQNTDHVLTVHLPGSIKVNRWSSEKSRSESCEIFGKEVDKFWAWQEQTAEALWNLALRLPEWPPQSTKQVFNLIGKGLGWISDGFPRHFRGSFMADSIRPISHHLKGLPDLFRLFIDGQLLIAAQTTSNYTYALYGASALDLPKRGVAHMYGGIGRISETLTKTIRDHGAAVLFRNEVVRIEKKTKDLFLIHTKRGEIYQASIIVANLPPWNIAKLIDGPKPQKIQALSEIPKPGWGAFMLYVGFDERIIPENYPLHHQVLQNDLFGEGNSIFMSLSPSWDPKRAPIGKRALTISTHTKLLPWWELYHKDREDYEKQKNLYTDRILQNAETAIPGLRKSAHLILPGTPVTFQRYTRRMYGWVGGFPQTNLFTSWGPRIEPNIWMVGDSIFPGQSTAAVSLGGIRVAKLIINSMRKQT